uniref:Uncharacterized protein n=1 Tax=Oryza brachyantha TaxID=4533 RepID=J3LVB2_ORYBR
QSYSQHIAHFSFVLYYNLFLFLVLKINFILF